MKLLKTSALLAIVAAANMPTVAIAKQAQNCLTAEQLGDVSVAVLPGLVTKLSSFCATALPANASLSVSGANAAQRYAEATAAARPSAFETIKLVAGDDLKIPGAMTPDVLFPFLEAMAAGEMEKMNQQEVCPVANNIWSAVKDVPMDKWGMIVGTLVTADRNSKAVYKSSKQKLIPCSYTATEELPVVDAK